MKRTLIACASAGALLLLAACGSSDGNNTMPGGSGGMSMSSSSNGSNTNGAAAAHNAADVTFATDMIPHHTQAVTMADMALAKTQNADIKKLATAIRGAQDPEIKTMSAWLKAWGQPVPTSTMSGMDHGGGMTMTGMMSDAEMAQLGSATGAAFDRLWVTMMTTHHTGAVTMATTELTNGQNTDAKALAQSIITSQTTEIATMKQLLSTLPS